MTGPQAAASRDNRQHMLQSSMDIHGRQLCIRSDGWLGLGLTIDPFPAGTVQSGACEKCWWLVQLQSVLTFEQQRALPGSLPGLDWHLQALGTVDFAALILVAISFK